MFLAPTQCPTCSQSLQLRELSCPNCGTTIRGNWVPSPFSRLTRDQQTFLLLFVRSRGNLSEVERALGVSYPTVRAKLEEVIAALGEEKLASHPRRASPRREVLERVARGELNPAEALALLRQQASSEDRGGAA